MVCEDNFIEEAAVVTLDKLIKEVNDVVLPDIVGVYQNEVEKFLLENRLVEKKKMFNQDDVIRIKFELICFAVFLIMVKYAPDIVTKNGLFRTKPDPEKAKLYNEKLLDFLEEFFVNNNFDEINEIVMTGVKEEYLEFGGGEPLTGLYRIQQYIDEFIINGDDASIKLYTTKLSYAIDPINLVLLQPIAIVYAGNTDEYVQALLKHIFKT